MKANIEFRIYDTYISGPPFEKKNPPSSGSAYGLDHAIGYSTDYSQLGILMLTWSLTC